MTTAATTTAIRKTYDPAARERDGARHFAPCAITAQQAKLWDETRTAFLWKCPAFAHILYTLMRPNVPGQGAAPMDAVAVFTADVPIAATDGVNLFLNPEPFFGFTLNERVFVIAHEVLHCIYDHCGLMHAFSLRGKIAYADGSSLPYIPELMNVAADLVINDMLVEAQIGQMPTVAMHDRSVATGNDAVIDAYKKCFDRAKGNGQIKQIGVSVSGAEAAGVKGEGFDEHLKPGSGQGKDPTAAHQERNDQQWKTELAAAVASARAQGKLPGNLERAFGQILTPQVSWQEHIQTLFARKVGNGAYDWRRADRRLITRDDPVFAPGRSGHGAGTIVLGVDTSGSINGPTLDMFFAEMAGILEDLRPKRMVIVWCDARVNRVDEAEDPGDLNVIRAKGAPGGDGTSFVPVFDEIQKLGLAPDALVYLTDGLGTFPSAAPSYPVIWGSIYLEADKYPFGDVVMIPKKA